MGKEVTELASIDEFVVEELEARNETAWLFIGCAGINNWGWSGGRYWGYQLCWWNWV